MVKHAKFLQVPPRYFMGDTMFSSRCSFIFNQSSDQIASWDLGFYLQSGPELDVEPDWIMICSMALDGQHLMSAKPTMLCCIMH
jgi:hypothetical protein